MANKQQVKQFVYYCEPQYQLLFGGRNRIKEKWNNKDRLKTKGRENYRLPPFAYIK